MESVRVPRALVDRLSLLSRVKEGMKRNLLVDSLFEGGHLVRYEVEEEGPGRRRVRVSIGESKNWFYWSAESD